MNIVEEMVCHQSPKCNFEIVLLSISSIFAIIAVDVDHCITCTSNGLNQTNSNSNSNGSNEQTSVASVSEAEARRHSSMDRIMSMLNDMGNSHRTRSLSDGGQDECNEKSIISFFLSDFVCRNSQIFAQI